MTSYRLDRRFVLTAVGVHLLVAGVIAAAAFFWWGPLGILAGLFLLNAVRVLIWPPRVARTDDQGVDLGGPLTVKRVRVQWSEVEDVTVEKSRLFFDRGESTVLVFPLAYVGPRATELAADVRERLNTSHGYTSFDPSGRTPQEPGQEPEQRPEQA